MIHDGARPRYSLVVRLDSGGLSGPFWSVAPDAMVIDALKLMAEKDVGASWS